MIHRRIALEVLFVFILHFIIIIVFSYFEPIHCFVFFTMVNRLYYKRCKIKYGMKSIIFFIGDNPYYKEQLETLLKALFCWCLLDHLYIGKCLQKSTFTDCLGDASLLDGFLTLLHAIQI